VITKPRLLVTRFSPHAEMLAEQLNHVGCFSIAQSLLTVKPLVDSVIGTKFLKGDYDIVIAVSGNAVKYTQQQLSSNWPNATYIAVGKSTQTQLKQVSGQNVLIPSTRFDSEGVLQLEPLKFVLGKKVLILRGQGGREHLDKTLIERGAQVDFLESYKRVELLLDGNKLANNWQQASINGAIISSVEILNQLFLVIPNKHKTWLRQLTFYVPSHRVAEYASKLGVHKTLILPSLRTEDIVLFFKAAIGKGI